MTPADRAARIRAALRRLVDRGHHDGTWTAQDVWRVADAHLPHPDTARLLRRATAEAARLRAHADQLEHDLDQLRHRTAAEPLRVPQPARWATLLLSPGERAIWREVCTGRPYADIAGSLDVSPGRIKNVASAVAQQLGTTVRQAMSMTLGGRVRVHTTSERHTA